MAAPSAGHVACSVAIMKQANLIRLPSEMSGEYGGTMLKGVLLFSHHHAYSVWGEGNSHIEVGVRKPITCGFISMQISGCVDLYFEILLQIIF